MRWGRIGGLAVGVALTVAGTALAGPNPVLAARAYAGRDGAEPQAQALKIDRLEVEVDLVGGLARTVVRARFLNRTDDALEGDFELDLPSGSVVTGYALDVGGKMVDGVLVDRRKGTEAYEEKVREGVDPGLAEVTREGAFRTRVFPILPEQGRTIRLEFVTPLAPDKGYALPLDTAAVGTAALEVRADRPEPPQVRAPEGLALTWARGPAGWEGRAAAKGRALKDGLQVSWTPAAKAATATRHRSGDVFLEIDDAAGGTASPVAAPERVRVYWDRSRSRRDDDFAAERRLLARYLRAVEPKALDVVVFGDGEPRVESFEALPEDAPQPAYDPALSAVGLRPIPRTPEEYRGATSLAGLDAIEAPRADVCLWFTDGNVTLDEAEPKRGRCLTFTVSSAADADRGFLSTLAGRSGGAHLDLRTTTAEAALARLTRSGPRVVGVTDAAGRDLDYTVLPTRPDRVRLLVRAPADGDEVVVEADDDDRRERRYRVDRAGARAHDAPGALWGAARVAELAARKAPREKVLAAARRWSVAGRETVFVVLEAVEDYAEAGIEPPASLGEAFRAEWRELTAEIEAEKTAERAGRLDAVAAAWAEQKAWWAATYRSAKEVEAERRREQRRERPAVAAAAPPPSPPPAPADAAAVEEIVMTGSRRRDASGADSADPRIEVSVEPWNPDRPYLQALAAAAPDVFWRVYEAQEQVHGDLPAFYLDVGEFLFRQGKADAAVAVALNAIELPSTDTTTLTILADRLMRYGRTERAIALYERILKLEPDRPQPRRNLALALVERADRSGDAVKARIDYARAMDLLVEVIETPWDGDYDGIELISLMEANRAYVRSKALGAARRWLDPRLEALLDVDLRVVLEWNTDKTDMDLWVDEPSGERAIYSRPRTGIGGRLSDDMTRGYGPEEYLLRRAPAGEYAVRVDGYAFDRLNPNGATTVRARLYRNWGRPDETAESLEIELTREAEGGQLVGRFKVGK